MTKRYTFFRIILLFALFVIPYLSRANGNPTGIPPHGEPGNPDSLAAKLGHCNPITFVEINCVTKTIKLSAFVSWTFTGVMDPVQAEWNTSEFAHSITVVPPGAWNWDPATSVPPNNCEMGHWANTYSQPGTFFDSTIDIHGQPLCDNGFISLTVTPDDNYYSFPNYTWNPPNQGGGLSPYEVTEPGLYSLTVVDQLGCPFTDQINIPNSPPVLPTLSGPTFMCPEGDTATVQTNQMWNAYQWSTSPSDTNQVITITEPGLYDVTVTNQFGCTGQGVFAVQSGQVDPFPISMTSPSICIGDLDTLRVVGGFSQYHWSNNVNGITNIVTQPGVYTVTVTNTYGCTGTGSVTVGLKPTPTIAITSTPFCPGGVSTLTVTGGTFANYLWSPGAQTTNPITVSLPGTYTVTVSGSTICATNTSVTIAQSPAPTVSIANPSQLNCMFPQTVINAGASSSDSNFIFSWTTVGGNIVLGQNTLTPTVNAAGTYTLLITNINTGCTATGTVAVTADQQAPPALAGNPATLNCLITNMNIGPAIPPPDTTLLPNWSASGGGFIVSGQNTWNPNINQPGTYTVTVTNPANHCTSTASVVISQNTTLPNSLIAAPSLLTCTADTSILDGSGSSNGPNFTYLWSTLDGTISGSTNTAVTSAASVGTYNLLVTNMINGCTAISSVTVAADINIPVTGAQPPATLTCVVSSVTIDALASSQGPTFSYTWTGPSPGSIIAGQGTLTPTVNAPGIYVLQLVNNANMCTATLSVNVPQNIANPVANAGPAATLNCVIPTLNLNGTASSQGPNFTYLWTTTNGTILNGVTTLTPTVGMAGTYTLQVTNQTNGCTSSSSVQVSNDANAPNADIANPATLTCLTLQTVINALASSQGPTYNYTWTGPSPTSIVSGQGTLQPTINAPGLYTLDIVNTANGCTDTDTITVLQDILAPVALAGNDELINCFVPAETIGSPSNPSGPNFTLLWTTVGGNFTSAINGPTVNINAAGTYTLQITNNTNGCTDTDVVVVTDDFVQPIVDAGPGFQLTCLQTSTVLQGSNAGPNLTYQWTTVIGGNIVSGATTLNPTVNASGTYQLLIFNTQNGCSSTDLVVVTQDANVPVSVIAQPNLLTCTLISQNLNANGSSVSPTISYNWTATNGGNITAGINTLTPTIDAPGTYTLQTTDATNSCSSIATINVLENVIPPVVDAGNQNTLSCNVLTLPLQATILNSQSPNISYLWSTLNGNLIPPVNTPTPSVDMPGLYTVVVTDAFNGCTGSDFVVIIEDVTDPIALIAQPLTLTCDLIQTQINATASSPGPNFIYAWTTNDGNILSGGSTNLPTVDAPGTYDLLITNSINGCTETASIYVPEDVVLPNAVAGPSVGLDCDTQTNALNGTASDQGPNFTYLWTTGPGGQIISGANTLTPQIGNPGDYLLTVRNTTNGCISTSSVSVTEDINPPVFSIMPPQLLTCVLLSTPLDGAGTGFGSAPTYTWSTSNGNIVSGANTLHAIVDAPGNYTLTILNTVNGCTDFEQVVVSENVAPPPLNTLPVSPLTCTVLQRTLQANAPTQALLQWTTLDGNIVSGANTPNPVVDEPGLYVVTATLPLNGCTSVANVPLLREQNIPTGLQFLLDPPLCNGTLGLLMVEQINGGIGPFEYSIDGGSTFVPAQDFTGLQPGSYDLVIRDANGCKIMQNVPVPAPPTPAVSLPPSFSIVLGENQELQAVVPPAFPIALIDQVTWEPMTSLTFSGSTIPELLNPVAMPFVTTEYLVTIITKEGCRAESRTIIRVDRDIDIYAPNVIWTDDPDADNNAFTLFTRPGSVNQILSLQIYDRWGEQLYVNKNFLPDDRSLGWAGDYKGEPVNPGVFVWWAEVELIDGQKLLLKGDVTVIR